MLKSEGEDFSQEELEHALQNLVGKSSAKEALPKEYVTAEEFASDLLGFEEYEEGDEDQDLTGGAANAGMQD